MCKNNFECFVNVLCLSYLLKKKNKTKGRKKKKNYQAKPFFLPVLSTLLWMLNRLRSVRRIAISSKKKKKLLKIE